MKPRPSDGVEALRPLRKAALEKTERILKLVKTRSNPNMPAVRK